MAKGRDEEWGEGAIRRIETQPLYAAEEGEEGVSAILLDQSLYEKVDFVVYCLRVASVVYFTDMGRVP